VDTLWLTASALLSRFVCATIIRFFGPLYSRRSHVQIALQSDMPLHV
jgi:hypothetical protein